MTEDTGKDLNTQFLAAAFCSHCNIEFTPKSGPVECPECGNLAKNDGNRTTHSRPGARKEVPRAADATEVDELIGKPIGRYTCDGLLGVGAMGRVYLAKHKVLDRYCALKVLPPALVASDSKFVERLAEEAKHVAALNHPNIVTLHGIDHDRGYHFLEMEFVPGRTLRKLVDEDGRQDPIRATSLMLRIAEGLSHAHQERILHRDMKPDNVILTHLGVPKITDFGLAQRVVVEDLAGPHMEMAGTPMYMAPELFAQQHATTASDVYALGVLYFFLLMGREPFRSPVLADLIKKVTEEPVPNVRDENPAIALEMAECMNQMLSKAPENRPQSAIAAAQLLQAVLGEVEDLEQLMQSAFAHQPGVKWNKEGEYYRVNLKFADGRHQTVFVEPSEHASALRSVRISSVCCPANPSYFEPALRLNSKILHGGLAIAEIDGEAKFMMVDNYPRATVDPEEIRRSVLEVAHRADGIEKLLTGMDIN